MLKQLRIKNFKCWQDTGPIDMAPITLFFGPNSSGKSSIGQFLMMLKQTVESSDRYLVLHPGGEDSAVQLGSYQDMVHRHNSKNNISFEYLWDLETSMAIKNPMKKGEAFSGNMVRFKAEVGLAEEGPDSPILKRLEYQLKEDTDLNADPELTIQLRQKSNPKEKNKYEKALEKFELARRKRYRLGGSSPDKDRSILREYKSTREEYESAREEYILTQKRYELVLDKYTSKRPPGRAPNLKRTVHFYGLPDEIFSYYKNVDFVQNFNLWHERLFHSLYYLGPLRNKTERLYTWSGAEPESVGYSGENTVAAILAAASNKRKFNLRRRARKETFRNLIITKLKAMGLIEGFRLRRIFRRPEYEVNLRTKESLDWVDLPDVGFGFSQVLPVLVQCFYAPKNSIIIIEQPELHLHPSAQSELADVLIDVIKARENDADRNIQLLIETHSEHFLLRLLRRIAEKPNLGKEVSAYFANPTETPAKLEKLEINHSGYIKNWPENFFGNQMQDIILQAEGMMQSQNKKNGNRRRRKESGETGHSQ